MIKKVGTYAATPYMVMTVPYTADNPPYLYSLCVIYENNSTECVQSD